MSIRHHTKLYQLFPGVRVGTRCSSPHIVFSVWKRSSECDLRHQRILDPPPRDIFNKTRKSKYSHTKYNPDTFPE